MSSNRLGFSQPDILSACRWWQAPCGVGCARDRLPRGARRTWSNEPIDSVSFPDLPSGSCGHRTFVGRVHNPWGGAHALRTGCARWFRCRIKGDVSAASAWRWMRF